MSAVPASVVTDEKARTVTIRQAEYSLQQGTFSKGYHHVIYAGTVRVKRGFVNPGCHLTIYAERLVVDPGGGKIDVSGAAGKGYQGEAPAHATTYRAGTYDGEHGGNGKDGEAGQDGGDVTIYAGRVEGGPLEIVSRGGTGGSAQHGGNGKDGAQPEERPRPPVPKLEYKGRRPIDERHYENVYDWGDDVRKIGDESFWKAYLYVTHRAESGKDGGHGGHAGLAGRPGDGGKGGRIVLRTLAPPAASIPAPDVAGGGPGAEAKHGKPGQGADGGLGAKYLYKTGVKTVAIDWSAYDEKSEWDENWNTKNSTTFWVKVDHFKNLNVSEEYIVWDGSDKKLKLRAGQGRHGNAGGYGADGASAAPPVPSARRGADGTFVAERLDASGAPFRDVPYPYLAMLQRSATAALLTRDDDEAPGLLRWLLLLTAPYRDVAADAPEDARSRQQLYHEAEHALLTRESGAADRPVRCIYRDIERYAAFVETSLAHVARQEQYYQAYAQAQEDAGARKKALDEAIAEAEDHVTHLTGTSLAPGSIEYCREKEKQLKTAISELDVQVLSYRDRLQSMPTALQEEIDAAIRAKTQIDGWRALELIGMAAGVLINFAGAAGSILSMVAKVKDFYKEALDLASWGEIFKDGIWNREFGEVKADLKALLDTDEWKNASKDARTFATSVTDFWGKIEAYDEIQKSRKTVTFALDRVDIQARVLIFDTAKLELKKKRNEFEAFITKFLDEYEQARTWKHVFADYFDTCETRFDLLAHLAGVQADRRELEYQRSLCLRNLELLRAQRNRLDFDPAGFLAEDTRDTLEANLHLALEQGLRRILDEGRAFRLWTLRTHTFPKIPKNLTAEILRTRFHEPLWNEISTLMSSSTLPAQRDASDAPFVWTRDAYPELFKAFEKTRKMTLAVPVDPKSNVYFERLIDARVYLRGARVEPDSAFYCVLRHPGVSEFLDGTRQVAVGYQEPRSIEFSYVEVGTGPDARPDYHYPGAIEEAFDSEKGLARIRYSPYTTWEVHVVPDYRQNERSKVYNRGIDLAAVQQVELRVRTFFDSFSKPKRAVRSRARA